MDRRNEERAVMKVKGKGWNRCDEGTEEQCVDE